MSRVLALLKGLSDHSRVSVPDVGADTHHMYTHTHTSTHTAEKVLDEAFSLNPPPSKSSTCLPVPTSVSTYVPNGTLLPIW